MKKQSTILLIDSDKDARDFIETALDTDGYKTLTAASGNDGLGLAAAANPDVVLLDLELSDMDGIEAISRLRKWSPVPVIVISARTLEEEKVLALDSGADDYLTKPVGIPELLARIRAALRRQDLLAAGMYKAPQPVYKFDGLIIDFDRRLVLLNDEPVHFTQIEYKLVTLLAKNAGRVLTYDFMIHQIWGPYADNSNNQILRVNMAHIRRKIEKNPAEPHYLFTEIGVGYRMPESQ